MGHMAIPKLLCLQTKKWVPCGVIARGVNLTAEQIEFVLFIFEF